MDTPLVYEPSQENSPVTPTPTTHKQSRDILGKASLVIFLLTIFLAPLAFVSSGYAPIDTTKTIVIVFGALLSCILYAISAFKGKKISVPKHPIFTIGVLLVISTIISTFVSTSFQKSLIGQGFGVTTASFLILMFVVSFFVSRIASKNKDGMLFIYGAFIASFLLLALFHILRLFAGPDFLSFGTLTSVVSSLIGPWYDLGIFAGMAFLISFFAGSLLSLRKSIKILLYAVTVLSGFIMLLINSYTIWVIMAIIFGLYLAYSYAQTPAIGTGVRKITSRISYLTLAIFILSLIFVWKGTGISNSFSATPQFEQNNISLPWQLALDVTADTIKEKPLFGAGPNRFGSQFLLNKPQIINNSQFWNIEFDSGFGFLPSFLVTHGIVGGILWVLFLIAFISVGIKSLRHAKEGFARFAIISSFFTASFLWLVALIYTPSHVLIFFTFIVTGIFLAVLGSEGVILTRTYSSHDGIWTKRLVLIVGSLSIIILVLWAFVYIKKFVAIEYFQKGITALNMPQGAGVDSAQSYFKSALAWDKADIYYQALSEVNIIKITAMAQTLQAQNEKDPKSVDQELAKAVMALIQESVEFTRQAIALDPANYYNYVAEARISEIALSLQIPNGYENAKNAYTSALNFNPYNPALYLNLARVEAAQNKLDEAQKNIGAALQLKSNYTEAVFLLSQIQVNQGKIKDAITSVQFAAQINPNNPQIFFQLGFLYYNDKNYQSANEAFNKAIELDPEYANARYFLGLSYARLGRTSDAVAQFEILARTNPENQEVALILSNLRSGKSPFTDAEPPVDSKPEKRKSLPVKEQNP